VGCKENVEGFPAKQWSRNGLQLLLTQEVKVIRQKGRIIAAHGRFSGIRRVAPVCTPPNTCFLRPTRVHNPNGISIGSAIFVQLTAVCHRACSGMTQRWLICMECNTVWHCTWLTAAPPAWSKFIVFIRTKATFADSHACLYHVQLFQAIVWRGFSDVFRCFIVLMTGYQCVVLPVRRPILGQRWRFLEH